MGGIYFCLSFFADRTKSAHIALALCVVLVAVLAGLASYYISGGGKDYLQHAGRRSIFYVASLQVVTKWFLPTLQPKVWFIPRSHT